MSRPRLFRALQRPQLPLPRPLRQLPLPRPLRQLPLPHPLRQPPTPLPYTSPPPASLTARINRRLPPFLHKHTRALAHAPVSHITAFLILHELTAILPLLGLAAYFHYTHWVPRWVAEGAWVVAGAERFGRYFRRKGWVSAGEAGEAEREVRGLVGVEEDGGEGGVRLVVEFATAWAVTKALVVPRVVLSVWATPGFARAVVGPVAAGVRRWVGRGKK
ncbi:hypothetical protein BDU57DRAFT_554083 [Ampelomyces quisqualis]|uniref:Uncharacterized protein n=1 Tax=Ampelomyces quisqualis TaxID=50730 RepID=A0A6A5QS69_AMPQU|nr:hypothetical protein BDU57DRAFT_554083 [Ampelomyces quisqualis]